MRVTRRQSRLKAEALRGESGDDESPHTVATEGLADDITDDRGAPAEA